MSAIKDMPLAPGAAAQTRGDSTPRLLRILTVLTIVSVAVGLYLMLFFVGEDSTQGEVQRIFYIHVPAFSGAFVAFAATVVGGVMYLRTKQVKWDTLALAGVEVGLTLGLVNLTTGMVWERPTWGTWWTWDPRLTWAAIMILTYAAYLMLRNSVENPEQRRRFASVYGILAMATVIMTLIITRVRSDTIHPVVIGPSPQNAQGGFEFTARIGMVVGINSAVWSILVVWTLMWYRVRLQNFADRVGALKAELLHK
jgi:heme exporter protein C